MKLNPSGPKERMTRREFLQGIRPKRVPVTISFQQEACTACGLCMADCQTRALALSRSEKGDTYRFLFRPDLCDACGCCERSCPEKCIQLAIDGKDEGGETKIIFEDKVSRCIGCGTPLFPEAMVKKLETKIFAPGKPRWPINLCPSCRMKSQFDGVGKRKT